MLLVDDGGVEPPTSTLPRPTLPDSWLHVCHPSGRDRSRTYDLYIISVAL